MAGPIVQSCTDAAWLCWVEAHPGLAGWFQTVGTFVALALTLVALRASIVSAQHDRRLAHAREQRDELRSLRAEFESKAAFHTLLDFSCQSVLIHARSLVESLADPETREKYALVNRKHGNVTQTVREACKSLQGIGLGRLGDFAMLDRAAGIAGLGEVLCDSAVTVMTVEYPDETRAEMQTHIEALLARMEESYSDLMRRLSSERERLAAQISVHPAAVREFEQA